LEKKAKEYAVSAGAVPGESVLVSGNLKQDRQMDRHQTHDLTSASPECGYIQFMISLI